MLELMGQVMRLPLGVFLFALERASEVLEEMDRATQEGWHGVRTWVGGTAEPPAAARQEIEVEPGAGPPPAPTEKEERRVPDTNLSDDMVKLVRYSIVSIERDELAKLVTGEHELFDDNMDSQAFANWVTAKHATAVAGHDSKYLRVSYEVLQRWPKQDREYERKQLRELEGIRQAIVNL